MLAGYTDAEHKEDSLQTDCRPSVDYPCLDCKRAAEDHEVHPFFDRPSWQDGYGRGYTDGRIDGEHLVQQALRTDLLQQLQAMAWDVRFGFRYDLETPLGVIRAVTLLIEDRQRA